MSDYLAGDPNNQVIRYQEPEPTEWQVPERDHEAMEAIRRHIETHLGKVIDTEQNLSAERVRIDVHLVGPSQERPFFTCVTAGMSDRPMAAPAGAEECRYAELLVALPFEWADNRENWWPIGMMDFIAQMPHVYDTWVWWGHTIPNGDPPTRIDASTQMTGCMLMTPVLAPEEFLRLEVRPDKVVHFLSLVPLHTNEMTHKLKHGAEALAELLAEADVTELLDHRRPSVVKKRWFWQR